MPKFSFYKKSYILSLFFLLAACGQSSSPPKEKVSPVDSTFGVFLAKTNNSQCTLFNNDKIIQKFTTNEDGLANFADLLISSGHVLLQCEGGQYVDEATSQVTTLTQTLSAATQYTSGVLQLVVSPVSEMAYRKAVATNDLNNIDEYNKVVSKRLGFSGESIIKTIPTDINNLVAEDNDEGEAALILAALSQISKKSFSTSLSEMLDTFDEFLESTATKDFAHLDISQALENLIESDSSSSRNILESYDVRVNIARNESLAINSTNVLVTQLSIQGNSNINRASEKNYLPYKIKPLDATNIAVHWHSSNPKIAIVSTQTGRITPISTGFTTISATTLDGSNIMAQKLIEIGDVPLLKLSSPLIVEYGSSITRIITDTGGELVACTVQPTIHFRAVSSIVDGICQISIENLNQTSSQISILASNKFGTAVLQHTIELTPKPITVVVDSASKQYGNADPDFTYQVSGLVNGDSLSGSLTREAGENVGSYQIIQGNLSHSNYLISFSTGTFNITPKSISVVADAVVKGFGQEDPTLSYTVVGLINDDTLSGSLTREMGEDVGSYVTGIGSLSNPNYSINFTSSEFTIAPKVITVAADSQSKEYGATDSSLTYQVSGLSEGETLSGSLIRDSGEDVGSYTIRLGSLNNSNYSISFTNNQLNIIPKPITVIADSQSKVHGESDPLFTYQVTGLVQGDSLTGALSRFSGEDVGSYVIGIGTLSNGNYEITFTSAILSISPSIDQLKAESPSFAKFAFLGSALNFNESSANLVYTDEGYPYLINHHHEFLSTFTQVVSYSTQNTQFLIARLTGNMTDLFEIDEDERSIVDGGDDDTKQITLDDLGIGDSKVFIYATKNVEIKPNDFPQVVQNWFNSSNISPNTTLSIKQGLSMNAEMDVNEISGLGKALTFITLDRLDRKIPISVPIELANGLNMYHSNLSKSPLKILEIEYKFNETGINFGGSFNFVGGGNNDASRHGYVGLNLKIERTKDDLFITLEDKSVDFPTAFSADAVGGVDDIHTYDSKFTISVISNKLEQSSGRVFLNITNKKVLKLFNQDWLAIPPNTFNTNINLSDSYAITIADDILNSGNSANATFFFINYSANIPLFDNYVITLKSKIKMESLGGISNVLFLPRVGYTIHQESGKIGKLELFDFSSKLMVKMIKQFYPPFHSATESSIKEPITVSGVLPEGKTLDQFEAENGHPPGIKFFIEPSWNFPYISYLSFNGELHLFDKKFGAINSFEIGIFSGINIEVVSDVDFSSDALAGFDVIDTGALLRLSVPGLSEIAGLAQDAVVEEDNFIEFMGTFSTDLTQALFNMNATVGGNAEILTIGGGYAQTIKPGVLDTSVTGTFGGLNATMGLNQSVVPGDPAAGFQMVFDNEDILSSAKSAITNGFNSSLDVIDTNDADARIEELEGNLAEAEANYDRVYDRAAENKRKAEQSIQDAKDTVNDARNDLKYYDYHAYYKLSSKRYCALGICTPSERDLAYVPWQAGRFVYTSALWVEEQALELAKRAVSILPVSAYPEVIAAQAEVDSLKFQIATVQSYIDSINAIKDALKTAVTGFLDTFNSTFWVNSFEIYGQLGLEGGIGIKGDITLLGKNYSFNKSLDYDITDLRDDFFDILYDYIWKPIVDFIVDGEEIKQAEKHNTDNNIGLAPPTGKVPDLLYWQDNSTDNNSFSVNLLDHISDTVEDQLTFSASDLPKRFKLTESGSLSGEFTSEEFGIHNIDLTVTDLQFAQLKSTFSITIQGKNSTHSIKILSQHAYNPNEYNTQTNSTDDITVETSLLQIPGNALASDYTDLAFVAVEDLDKDSSYTYAITIGNASNHFTIDNNGNIALTPEAEGNLTAGNYDLTISVTDNSVRIPSIITVTTSLTIQIQPTIWLEVASTLTADTPQFILRTAPLPERLIDINFVVHYQVESSSLPTDDPNHSLSYESIFTLEWGDQQMYDDDFWHPSIPVALLINPLQRHSDREYKITLLSVVGNANIDQNNKQKNTVVYASNPPILGRMGQLNDTGIAQWGDLTNNSLQKDQTDIKQQDADVGLDSESSSFKNFRFSQLTFTGTTATASTDVACVIDHNTNLRWVRPALANQQVDHSGIWISQYGNQSPINNTKDVNTKSGFSNLSVSQPLTYHYGYLYGAIEYSIAYGIDGEGNFSTNYYVNKVYTYHSYCSQVSRSSYFHIPTVKQLQGLLDYSKTQGNSLLNETFFSDIQGSEYLAVGIDFPQIMLPNRWSYDTNDTRTLKQLADLDPNDYIGDIELVNWLLDQINGEDNIMSGGSEFEESNLELAKTILSKLLYTVNISTGEVTRIDKDDIEFYSYLSSHNDYGVTMKTPYYKGNIIWVSDPNKNALFAQMIHAFFRR